MGVRLLLVAAVSVAASSNLASAQEWPAPAQQDWQRFVIPETRAAVDIPTGLFSDDAGAVDGDIVGHRFVTSDGRANLTVQSVRNASDDPPAVFLARMKPPAGVIYRRVTPRFFVVSSVRDGKIWYNRCNRARRMMNCILINYPAAEKRRWDDVVTRISRTLDSGA
ncbi:hypothetical protein BH11PSE4_BH11PSE4_37190 [soil metagenome]